MNISYSKVELYNQCGYKYYLSYVEGYRADQTVVALLFGLSIDKALNYLLLRKKHNHVPNIQVAEALFLRQMKSWNGQNELIYFKNECPEGFDELEPEDQQRAVWNHLVVVGQKMIRKYLEEVLPIFKRIISVQTKKKIDNGAGDVLVLVTDFVAELHDGRIAVWDNKTSSDIKKNYGPGSVENSTQLAIYSEYETTKFGGYVALQKKLVKGEVVWTYVIEEVPETQVIKSFERLETSMEAIKSEVFEKNQKSCWAYGKKCEFFGLCKYGNAKGLVKK